MYSPRNIFLQEPTAIAGALVLLLNATIGVFHIPLTGIQVGLINTALVALLNLFYVRPMSVSKDALKKLSKR